MSGSPFGIGEYFAAEKAAGAQEKAASTAADAQLKATAQIIASQEKMQQQIVDLNQPFYEAGKRGLSDLESVDYSVKTPDLESLKLDFEFNPEDPVYKYKQAELEKSVNRQLAARGLYDSRPGLDVQAKAGMELISSEVDKQYGRSVDEYDRTRSNMLDTYNIENQQQQLKYGRAIDLVKGGMGASGQMGAAALQAGGAVASAYGQQGANLGAIALQQGNAEAQFYGGLAAMPSAQMSNYYSGTRAGLWGGNYGSQSNSGSNSYFGNYSGGGGAGYSTFTDPQNYW